MLLDLNVVFFLLVIDLCLWFCLYFVVLLPLCIYLVFRLHHLVLLLLFCIKLHLLMLIFREPDTPVTQLNNPRGNFTLIFFKLFSVASCTSITFNFTCFLLFLGTAICFLPLKYCPVIEFSTCLISSAVPLCHYFSTMCSCSWSNIYYLVCCIHCVFIMFYYK